MDDQGNLGVRLISNQGTVEFKKIDLIQLEDVYYNLLNLDDEQIIFTNGSLIVVEKSTLRRFNIDFPEEKTENENYSFDLAKEAKVYLSYTGDKIHTYDFNFNEPSCFCV